MSSPTIRRSLRPLILFGLLLGILVGALYYVVGYPLRTARGQWRQGDYVAARETLSKWSRLRIRPRDYDHMFAVVHLSAGNPDGAQPYLDRMSKRKKYWFPVIRKEEIAHNFIATGRNTEFLKYDTAVQQRIEPDDLPLYRAAAQLGTGRLDEARTTFATIEQDSVDRAKYDSLQRSLGERTQGLFPYVLDRDGKTIASYHHENRDVVPTNTDFTALIDRSAGAFSIEAQVPRLGTSSNIETTLDSVVQKAAVAALAGLRGSLVVIDTRTNEILAIASSPGSGPLKNLAFERQYEPGSVMKVVTALNAAESGIDFQKVFPINCDGYVPLSGRQFFDWASHENLPDLNEALAVSCNIAFARLGIQLGEERVQEFMRRVGFGADADLGVMRVPLGRMRGDRFDDFALANMVVGLQYETTNALHIAMLASMIANRGSYVIPKLVRGRRSILGEPFGEVPVHTPLPAIRADAVQKVIPAMQAVVTNPRGSGRRAAVPGLAIAMNTGTAGTAEAGYDALVLAFAPVDNPRIAIGFVGENSGPAEFAGAKVAHDFFSSIPSRFAPDKVTPQQ